MLHEVIRYHDIARSVLKRDGLVLEVDIVYLYAIIPRLCGEAFLVLDSEQPEPLIMHGILHIDEIRPGSAAQVHHVDRIMAVRGPNVAPDPLDNEIASPVEPAISVHRTRQAPPQIIHQLLDFNTSPCECPVRTDCAVFPRSCYGSACPPACIYYVALAARFLRLSSWIIRLK